MVGTISRGVRAHAVQQRAIWLFLSACAIGGGALGYTAGLTGEVVKDVGPSYSRHALILVASLLSALVVAEHLALPHPHVRSPSRQVRPDAWTRHGPARAAILWGAELGLAVTTRMQSWAIWAMLAWVLLSGSTVGGLIAGLAFGAARGLQVPASVTAQAPTTVAWRVNRVLVLRHK